VRPARGSLKGKARWQVIFRLPEAGSRFTLSLDSGATQIVSAGVGTAHPSGVSSIDLESDAEATLRIGQAALEPEIFAVVVEGSEPGLVLDTLGINGARVATSLTWDEGHFTGELQRRKPDLVVLAYGTNEVGDALAPFRYADHYEALLTRVRAAAPGASCLLLGPTDRALPDWSSNPRSVEIEQVQREVAARAGCGFFSMLAAMGGPGSLQRWAFASPTLARKDRVHLTIDGYTQLGEALAQHLLQQWRGP
jgi:lysophospholipase L1-like esterase